jgi:hypothetical protein
MGNATIYINIDCIWEERIEPLTHIFLSLQLNLECIKLKSTTLNIGTFCRELIPINS